LGKNPRKAYEKDAQSYLEKAGDRYVLNESGTLYEAKCDQSPTRRNENHAGTSRNTPFHVDILRDWIPLTISALTLILLAFTIHYARLQWKTMNQTFWEIQKQTGFAQTTAADATQNMKDAEEFFRTDERAWVVIDSVDKTATFPPESTFGTIFKFSVFLKNVGKTVAHDVRIHCENPDVPQNFMEDKHAILMSQDQLFHEMGTNRRSIMPDSPGPQTLAPGARSPVPVFTGGQEPRRYGDNFRYTAILGRVDYIDAFGAKHWVHFCYVITNSKGELAHCKYGNDQDNNPETLPQERK
jgi:hypothetical protein